MLYKKREIKIIKLTLPHGVNKPAIKIKRIILL